MLVDESFSSPTRKEPISDALKARNQPREGIGTGWTGFQAGGKRRRAVSTEHCVCLHIPAGPGSCSLCSLTGTAGDTGIAAWITCPGSTGPDVSEGPHFTRRKCLVRTTEESEVPQEHFCTLHRKWRLFNKPPRPISQPFQPKSKPLRISNDAGLKIFPYIHSLLS